MVNNRTTVARVVYSGELGPAGSPNEIWSTGFWVAEYASEVGADVNMEGFDPGDYLANHAHQFGTALMTYAQPYVKLTVIKCNVFDLVKVGAAAPSLKQTTDPTVLSDVAITGGGNESTPAPYFAAMGWALSSSTGGTRGRATKGRMFLPPMGEANNSFPDVFDQQGDWTTHLQNTVSAALSPAWTSLMANDSGSESTFLPSMVSIPTTAQYAASPQLMVNGADTTTVESVVWTMHSRKNKLSSGGVTTTHPTFD